MLPSASMELTEKEDWQKLMVQAARESGAPEPEVIEKLFVEILAEPDAPPTSETLWPIFSFIRTSLQQNVPLNWLTGEDLRQTLAPLLENPKNLLDNPAEAVALELMKGGKIMTTSHLNCSPEDLAYVTRESVKQALVILSQKLGMKQLLTADEVQKMELTFQLNQDVQILVQAKALITRKNRPLMVVEF